MTHAAEMRLLHQALDAARPLLVGRSIRERLEIARQIETELRNRFHVEPLTPVPASTIAT